MMRRYTCICLLIVVIVVGVFVSYGVFLSTKVSIELTTGFGAASSFDDAYLTANIYVPWSTLAVRVYGAIVRIQGFSWRDHSGQYAYTGKAHAVINENPGANALIASKDLNTENRVTAPLMGRKLSQGFSQTTATGGNVIRFYYGVSFTGQRAEGDYTGPYDGELRYSFLGIPMVVRDSWHAW